MGESLHMEFQDIVYSEKLKWREIRFDIFLVNLYICSYLYIICCNGNPQMCLVTVVTYVMASD